MVGSDVTSLITISLLQNMSATRNANGVNTGVSNNSTFESLLSGLALGTTSGSGCSCSCNNSEVDILDTLGKINSVMNGVNNIIGTNGVTDKEGISSALESIKNTLETMSESVSNTGVVSNTDSVSSVGAVANSKSSEIVSLLEKQIGKPYVWGANGPDSFDCSGLSRYVYKEVLGKDIPRVSYDQAKTGVEVKKEDLQVGDLVFFDTMNKGRVSHVGVYVGNNEFIHASNPKDGVKKSKLEGYYTDKFICARRP